MIIAILVDFIATKKEFIVNIQFLHKLINLTVFCNNQQIVCLNNENFLLLLKMRKQFSELEFFIYIRIKQKRNVGQKKKYADL